MVSVSRNVKMYLIAVGLLALWVGVWGFFIPERVDKAIPWLVPPLHARFIGAIYFSGVAFTFGGMLAREYAAAKFSILISTIWTGLLFIISLFYLNEFDFTHKPVWFWFGAYILYPIIGSWLLWNHRNTPQLKDGKILPSWVKTFFLVQGILITVLALALLLLPDVMLNLWPWKITRLLAQIYSGPFLAYGITSLLMSRENKWQTVQVSVTSMIVLAIGTLLASFIHRDLFSTQNISAWVWFLGFAIEALILTYITYQLRKK